MKICPVTKRLLLRRVCLVLLALLNFPNRFVSKSITFRAMHVTNRPLPSGFHDFFCQPDTPLKVLSLNPGLELIEHKSGGIYVGYLAPVRFPGLTVRSVVQFDVQSFSDDCENETGVDSLNVIGKRSRLEVRCLNGAVTQTFEGNALFVKVFSRLLPSVSSETILRVDAAKGLLTNSASLSVAFALPDWLLIDTGTVEKGGSEAIQRSLEHDMERFLDALVNTNQ